MEKVMNIFSNWFEPNNNDKKGNVFAVRRELL